jgi:CheY-like chemotaxis protein
MRESSLPLLAPPLLGETAVASDPLDKNSERARKAKFAPPQGLLFVVSPDALDQYEHLQRVFANDKRVKVILDRRSGERRKAPAARDAERRRGDRRSRSGVDDKLRQQGWAMVRVELSVAPDIQVSPEPVEPVESVKPEAPARPAKSILVVDGDPKLAQRLGEILMRDGHHVTVAGTGVEAITLLAVQAFDLLLIDIRVPELDGPELYRELQRRSPEHARRVMFMASGAVGAETAELLSTVRAPLLRKPLDVTEFREAVHRFFLAADSFRRRE